MCVGGYTSFNDNTSSGHAILVAAAVSILDKAHRFPPRPTAQITEHGERVLLLTAPLAIPAEHIARVVPVPWSEESLERGKHHLPTWLDFSAKRLTARA